MRARAPGKLVLSGAYAVLYGGPAIVTAVSRYVIADSARPAERVTPELGAALGGRRAPWFDAGELFARQGKLGLGASAAILVACLAALELDAHGELEDRELVRRVLPAALRAHAAAQGGGSGIDVAVSAHGGTLLVARSAGTLAHEPAELPPLVIEAWSSGEPASTPELLGKVRALVERDPRAIDAQRAAAHAAETAVRARDPEAFVSALARQLDALTELGDAAGAPIVTPAARELAALARSEAAIVLPSGAGGGDVVIYAGARPPGEALRAAFARLDHARLELGLGARGVHQISTEPGVDDPEHKR